MIDLSAVNIILGHYRKGKLDRKTTLEILNDLNEDEYGGGGLEEIIFLVEGRHNMKIVGGNNNGSYNEDDKAGNAAGNTTTNTNTNETRDTTGEEP